MNCIQLLPCENIDYLVFETNYTCRLIDTQLFNNLLENDFDELFNFIGLINDFMYRNQLKYYPIENKPILEFIDKNIENNGCLVFKVNNNNEINFSDFDFIINQLNNFCNCLESDYISNISIYQLDNKKFMFIKMDTES